MTAAKGNPLGRQLRRPAWLTVGLALVVLTCIVTVFWLRSSVLQWFYWKMGLILLIVVEVAYGVALALATLGSLVMGAFLVMR